MVTTIYIKKDDEKTWKAFIKKYKYTTGFSSRIVELVKNDIKTKN